MNFIYVIRTIAIFLMAGSVGSVEIDRIDLWTGFCQSMLGLTLLILSNFWMREIRKEIKK